MLLEKAVIKQQYHCFLGFDSRIYQLFFGSLLRKKETD